MHGASNSPAETTTMGFTILGNGAVHGCVRCTAGRAAQVALPFISHVGMLWCACIDYGD